MTERRRRILLTDDDEDSLHIYRTILEHGGFEVIEARTGVEAVERARALLPDLILMDAALPLMDGWRATRVLKGAADTRHILVIALTAHVLGADRAHARQAGCDGFLAKPASPRTVLAEVCRFLERAPAPPACAARTLPRPELEAGKPAGQQECVRVGIQP
ncbi:response regulator [Longimicrobium sp.]|uniref:response regulator n=1 Tax=Longimicrobium sp. TaxID=2029185 RepID=UPI003B3AA8CC